jgi:hypothetical protein
VQKPSLGRVVLVVGEAAKSTGVDVAPATIMHVWGEHPDGGHTVNLHVLPDATGSTRIATGVRLVETEDEARALLPSNAAYWPLGV